MNCLPIRFTFALLLVSGRAALVWAETPATAADSPKVDNRGNYE